VYTAATEKVQDKFDDIYEAKYVTWYRTRNELKI
jgi:hypothetical protein